MKRALGGLITFALLSVAGIWTACKGTPTKTPAAEPTQVAPTLPDAGAGILCDEPGSGAPLPEGCHPIAPQTLADCVAHGHFFIEETELCTEECGEQYDVEGSTCKGKGAVPSPGCHDPTPHWRCIGNYCACTRT